MRSNKNTIKNVKEWLEKNGQNQVWLANKMELTPSLIKQLFDENQELQSIHIEKFSKITGLTISELSTSHQKINYSPIYSIRGRISNKQGERALEQLLIDSDHFDQLLNM